MSSQNTTPNGHQSHPMRTRSTFQGKRSSSRIKSQQTNKSKEEIDVSLNGTDQENSGLQNSDSDELHSTPKRMKTLSSLPSHWCRTKVSTFKYTFQWTVQNFSLFSLEKPGEAITSSKFKIYKIADFECQLLLYPNGHDNYCENNVCAGIQLSRHLDIEVGCELKFLNSCGIEIKNTFCTGLLLTSGGWCLYKRNEILSFLEEDDTLVVICTLTISENITEKNIENDENVFHQSQNMFEFLNNLNKLRKQKEFCDVTFCIDDEEIFAHESVLSARSSYFKQLFDNVEGERIKFNIDVKSSVMEKILDFLYTGEILDMETSANELFEAACKFELPVLKTMCEKYFKKNLSLDNAFDILSLADKVDAPELQECAINYIVAYSTNIANSPGFTNKLSPDLMMQVLQKCYA